MDLIFPMSQWVNSRFVLSYCNGFGEALTSYNKQTTSLPYFSMRRSPGKTA